METSQAVLSVNGSDENRPAIVNVSMTTLLSLLSSFLSVVRSSNVGGIMVRHYVQTAKLLASLTLEFK